MNLKATQCEKRFNEMKNFVSMLQKNYRYQNISENTNVQSSDDMLE